MTTKRQEYANKCLRYEETVQNEWTMDIEAPCLSGKKVCGLGEGAELVETTRKSGVPIGDYTILDACNDDHLIGDFSSIPKYLDAREKETKLVIHPRFQD